MSRESARHRYDAIVAGGGHNGLVAAFYLAKAGLSTLVLERRERVGGPAAAVEFFPGYRGAMTNSPGSLEPKIVTDMELGRFGLAWTKPDPAVLMPFPDRRFFVGWRDQDRLRRHIAESFSERDAQAYSKVFAFFDDFAKRLGVSLFEPPPSLAELAARLKTPADEADFATVFFGNMRDFIEERLETEEMRVVVAMLSTGAVAPSTPGSLLALMWRPMSLFSSVATDVHDPRNQPLRGSTGLPLGGMGSIVEAMARACESLGVAIRTQATIERFLVNAAGEAQGVVLSSGEEFYAPLVLSNLHPKTALLGMLDAKWLPDEILGRLRRLPAGSSTFKVVLGVDEPPLFAGAPPQDAHAYSGCQFRIAPNMDWLEQCYDDFRAGRSTHCPRLLGLTPTFLDPTMAPPGKHLVSVNAWYFPNALREGDWASERDVMGERIISILTDYIPSLSHSIVAKKFYSPNDIEAEYGLLEGNFTHGEMLPPHMFSLRPVAGLSNYRTPVRGLYLCGSGSWPGGTVTGAPGHNAAHCVLADLASKDEIADVL